MKPLAVVLSLLAGLVTAAGALEIPLTVEDRAGADRTANHVTGGVPLPMGAVKDVGSLGLFRRDPLAVDGDQPVPAAFVLRQKYQADGSARWVTVHFLANLSAKDKVQYVVKDAKGAAPPFPVAAQAARDKVTVDTGVIRFAVNRNNFNVIDQAWFDPTGKGKYGKPFIEPGSARLKVNLQSGKYKVVSAKASLDVIGDPADVTAKVATLELEENTPARAVVKVAGQFMQDRLTPTLDFVCRMYALAGSGAVRVSFTVVNRSGVEWRDFWGINELSLELPVRLGDQLRYTLSASEGEEPAGPVPAGQSATILAPHSEEYILGGLASGTGKAKGVMTRRLGWADLSGPDAGVVVAIRHFWQMHPKGLAVSGDGVLSIQLVPKQEKPAEPPPGATTQSLTRIDLFTGGARTHEFLIAAHRPDDRPRAIALSVVDPLLAVAPTAWYCQKSQAEGLLWDANPDNFKPEYRELVAAFQQHLEACYREVVGRRGGAAQGLEEYGMLTFGAGVEHKDYVARNDFLNTRFDGNYYDYPRAALVNFWRTGNLDCYDTAEAAALHLADLDIAHKHVSDPKLAGVERTCPSRGHFRQWWSGEPFGVSGNMDSTKSQSLYDLYHMTGDGWYLDCALLVASYSMNHTGGALRAIGNRAKNLLCAYEHAGEKKFLDENTRWLDRMLVPRSPQQSWDQNWMYGLAGEALADLYRATGEMKWAQTAVNCCDSLVNKHWKGDDRGAAPLAGFTVNCFGYAYEFTGDEAYLKKGLIMLKLASTEYAGRTKTFAQEFRISPYFLHYLTTDYKPPRPVVTK